MTLVCAIHTRSRNTAPSSSAGSQNFSQNLKAKALSRSSEATFESPPQSLPTPGFCSFQPNTETQQQNQLSPETLHRQSKARTTPCPNQAEPWLPAEPRPGNTAGNQRSAFEPTATCKRNRNQPPSSTHPNYPGLIAASRTPAKSWGEAGLKGHWSCQGPIVPLRFV